MGSSWIFIEPRQSFHKQPDRNDCDACKRGRELANSAHEVKGESRLTLPKDKAIELNEWPSFEQELSKERNTTLL
jgi:hypothetical protein